MALSSVVVFYLERIPYVCFVLMALSTVRVFYRSTATVASYNILHCSTHYVEIGLLYIVLVAALRVKRTLFYGFDDDERLAGVNRY